jgi:hypothetical protein
VAELVSSPRKIASVAEPTKVVATEPPEIVATKSPIINDVVVPLSEEEEANSRDEAFRGCL